MYTTSFLEPLGLCWSGSCGGSRVRRRSYGEANHSQMPQRYRSAYGAWGCYSMVLSVSGCQWTFENVGLGLGLVVSGHRFDL